MRVIYLAVAVLGFVCGLAAQSLVVSNTAIVDDPSKLTIYSNGQLNYKYDDSIYNTPLNCRSGDLAIINIT